MPWKTEYLRELDAVLVEFSGLIPPAELVQAARETMEVAKKHETDRLLGDCTKLEGGHTIVDLYGLARLVEEAAHGPIHEAVIMPNLQAAAKEVAFWETTSRNRGLDVRVFKTVGEGRAWLESLKARAPQES